MLTADEIAETATTPLDWQELMLASQWHVIDDGAGGFEIATSPHTDKARRGYTVARVQKWHGPDRKFCRELELSIARRIVDDHNAGLG